MDSILMRYGTASLPIEEMARLRCLPDSLAIGQIAVLWAYDAERQCRNKARDQQLMEAMKAAVRNGNLPAKGNPNCHATHHYFDATPDWLRGYGEPMISRSTVIHNGTGVEVARNDFRDWLEREGEWPLPVSCLLSRWWPDHQTRENEIPRKASICDLRVQCLAKYVANLEQKAKSQGKSFDRNNIDLTRAQMQDALQEAYPDVFPLRSSETFNDFWKRQSICKLRRGRRNK